MKRFIGITAILMATAIFLAVPGRAHAGVGIGISIFSGNFGLSLGYSDYPVYGPAWSSPSWSLSFTAALDGYGDWVEVDGLGRVWHPWVAADWRPYTYGRWVFTDLGWTWVAYEPWGYIPHHYGSWAMTTFGWAWVPGYTYYPAHVTWLSAGAYVGWYPAAPWGWSNYRRGYRHGYRHGFRRGYNVGYRDGWDDARYANYVSWNRVTSENLARYVRPGTSFSRLPAGELRPLRRGPDRFRVERATGRPLRVVPVAERQVRIGSRTVRAVRPEGVAPSIARHARQAVSTGLSPAVARRLEARPVSRTGRLQGRSQAVGRTSSFTRSTAAARRTSRWYRAPLPASRTTTRSLSRGSGSASRYAASRTTRSRTGVLVRPARSSPASGSRATGVSRTRTVSRFSTSRGRSVSRFSASRTRTVTRPFSRRSVTGRQVAGRRTTTRRSDVSAVSRSHIRARRSVSRPTYRRSGRTVTRSRTVRTTRSRTWRAPGRRR